MTDKHDIAAKASAVFGRQFDRAVARRSVPRAQQLHAFRADLPELLEVVLPVGKDDVVAGNGFYKMPPQPAGMAAREWVVVVIAGDYATGTPALYFF